MRQTGSSGGLAPTPGRPSAGAGVGGVAGVDMGEVVESAARPAADAGAGAGAGVGVDVGVGVGVGVGDGDGVVSLAASAAAGGAAAGAADCGGGGAVIVFLSHMQPY